MDERPSDVVVPGTTGIESSGEPSSGSQTGPSTQAASIRKHGQEKARQYGKMFRDQAIRRTDQRKGSIAATIERFAGAVEEAGSGMERKGLSDQRQYVDRAAEGLRGFSRQLRENSTEDLLNRAGDEFRARPGVMLAGCFAIGFLGARLIKS